MRGLLVAAGAAAVIVVSWRYQDAAGVSAGAFHSVAGLATGAVLGWITFCALLIRAIGVGAAGDHAQVKPRRFRRSGSIPRAPGYDYESGHRRLSRLAARTARPNSLSAVPRKARRMVLSRGLLNHDFHDLLQSRE